MSQDAIEIYNDGYCYYTGFNGYPLKHKKAFDCFKQAADLGVSHAMNYLGLIYEDGEITEQSYSLAFSWFNKAFQTDPNNAHAAYNLGRMYYYGTGTPTDINKAISYFEKAIEINPQNKEAPYPNTCYMIGCILTENYNNMNQAYPYFIEAAKYGNIPEAWYNLGWLSEKGVVPINNSNGDEKSARDGMARGFYEEAANLGYLAAMDAVGRLYILYNHIDQAKHWLMKAARAGYEPSKKRLKMLNVANSGSLFDFFK